MQPGRDLRSRLPQTALGLALLLFAMSVASAFSGAILYAYYDYRLGKTDDKVSQFQAGFGDEVDAATKKIDQSRDDAIGQILVFERTRGMLHMRHIASADLVDSDIDDYEMVVFDGGNTSGYTWKHVFFPRQREHYFVYEA